jgi:hypothetical protein
VAAIRIEILSIGVVHVALAQPRDPERSERLWRLYAALRPQIAALEEAARSESRRQVGIGGSR